MRGFGNMGGMGNMGNLMKQVQKAMDQAQKVEQELEAARVEGASGGGAVKVTATGRGKVESLIIDREKLLAMLEVESGEATLDADTVEAVQDLVLLAVQDALEKSDKLKEARVKELTGGFGVPGMPF